MPRIELDKERFKNMLEQFNGDAPYLIELIKKILDILSPQVVDNIVEELYFKYLYKGTVYVAKHCVFKEDIHYFVNLETLREFLKKVTLDISPEMLATLDDRTINRYEKRNQPICGYDIRKDVIK